MEEPEKKLCKGTTIKNEPCKNSPMKGADFCPWHSIGKFKGVPAQKNPIIIAIVIAVFSIAIGAVANHYLGREHTDTAKRTESKIDKLVKQINTDSEMLLKKYPHGYVLFNINSKGVITPYPEETKMITGVKIHWDSIRLMDITPENIIITAPSYNHTHFRAIVITVSRSLGRPVSVFGIKTEIATVYVSVEVMYDDGGDDIICLMGFGDVKVGSIPPHTTIGAYKPPVQ